jgi:chemotaxis protein MotB
MEHQAQDQETLIASLTEKLAILREEVAKITGEKTEIEASALSLREQITSLSDQLKELNRALDTSENQNREKDKNLKSLKDIGVFRSEFFSKLQKAVGARTDIRIVGDRFVFQSEVLFDKASAVLGAEGKNKLDKLIQALKDISSKIPDSVNWILRVDGHTDHLPIHNAQYPSNWELSSARAIAVVKYLTEKDIPAKHLVAAGFGEYQPMAEGEGEKDLARNRRIEFKLDQR